MAEREDRLRREELEEEKRYEAYCQAQLREGKRVQVLPAASRAGTCLSAGLRKAAAGRLLSLPARTVVQRPRAPAPGPPCARG